MAVHTSGFGWGKIRPSFLQWLNNPKWLLVFLCMTFMTMQLVVSGAYSVSVSTVEKRFGLSSSTSGLITSMFDIACLTVTAFVSYYGGQQSKARWLGSGLLVIALGSLIFVLPHFIIGPYDPGVEKSVFPSLCQMNSTNTSNGECDSTTSTNNHWYYAALLCVGMLVVGFGGSPIYVLGVAYLDESVKKNVSPMYLGIFTSSGILGAAVGVTLGGFLLSLNVDLGHKTSITPTDSRWIGNWWLAWVMGCLTSILLAPGIYGFPPVIRGAPENNNEQENNENTKHETDPLLPTVEKIQFTSFNDLIAATKMLFTSPSYVLISIGNSMKIFNLTGKLAFMPKVIQVLFNMTPSKVSFLYGPAVVPSIMMGELLGSYLVKKFKLGVKGALKSVCIVISIGSVVNFIYLLANCDNSEIIGMTKGFGNSTSKTVNGCQVPCDCNRWPYYPVCDGSTTLWSPCHARCSSYLKKEKTFHGCLCTTSNNSVVVARKCPKDCGAKPALFLLLTVVSGFLLFFIQTPITIAVLRSVPYRLRSYAIGWQLNVVRLLGAIPGPIVYGKLIDTACIQWQKTCEGQGSCQEYNHWHLVLIIVVVEFIVQIIEFASFTLAWKFTRNDLIENDLTNNTGSNVSN